MISADFIAKSLKGGAVRVKSGSKSSTTPIKSISVKSDQIEVEAEFAQDNGNHDWKRVEFLTPGGDVVDFFEGALGRKTSAARRPLTLTIELKSSS